MARIGAEKSKKQIEYLAAYYQSGDKEAAGLATNVPKRTYQRWFKDDPDFAKHTARIEDELFEGMERDLLPEAKRRALEGVVKVRYSASGECYEERVYSDVLMMFLLKAANRARYDDGVARQSLANSGMKEAFAELPQPVYFESSSSEAEPD